jgi:hypothetical protein
MKSTACSYIANQKVREMEMSRLSLMTVFALVIPLVFSGCTKNTGIVRLNTDPQGAQYYVDGIEKGATPAEFEWDLRRPVMLEIRKEGYHPEQELLNREWIYYQQSKGNYGKIKIGKTTKQWTVIINRKLKAAPPSVKGESGGQ